MSIIESDIYLKDVDYIINKRIIEYDMRDAGFNLCKYYHLLPEDTIESLSKLQKDSKKVAIGNLMRENRDFNIAHTKSFGLMRAEFAKANNLEDDDILSIKKDAIFVIGKKCKKTQFGNVEFVEKNVYSSFHRFNKLELYYSSSKNILDVKGISNEMLKKHTSTITILKRMMLLLENNEKQEFVSLVKDFVNAYKRRSLPLEYYREFNSESSYPLLNMSIMNERYAIAFDHIDKSMIDKIDISYNFLNLYLPIIQRFYYSKTKS